eukprot:264735-Pelagomonas_calceolata.AAC.1
MSVALQALSTTSALQPIWTKHTRPRAHSSPSGPSTPHHECTPVLVDQVHPATSVLQLHQTMHPTTTSALQPLWTRHTQP